MIILICTRTAEDGLEISIQEIDLPLGLIHFG